MCRTRVLLPVFVLLLIVAAVPTFAETGDPIVIEGFFLGESVPLSDIDADAAFATLATNRGAKGEAKEIVNRLDVLRKQARPAALIAERLAPPQPAVLDPVAQFDFGHRHTPAPRSSFEGMGNIDNGILTGFVIWPPDNDGDVGRKYYVQMNNISFEIFDKKTGATVLGPLPNVALWSSAVDEDGDPLSICGKNNDGDPIVLYDHQAQRWIFTQFALGAFEAGPPYLFGWGGYQCVAVSTSKDPRGSYYLYEFEIVPGDPAALEFGLNDYPKFGIWPDALYLSTNEFVANPDTGFAFSFQGASATAIDKWAMYAGKPTKAVKFFLPAATEPDESFHFSLQPSHWEGDKKPREDGHGHWRGHKREEGAPNIFIQNMDYETWGPVPPFTQPDGIYHWAFEVDFKKPAKSKFVDLGLIETPPFDSLGAYLYDALDFSVHQPDTPNTLDVLGQFTMTRAQYRSFGSYDAIVGNVATCLLPSGETCVNEAGDLLPGGQIATRWFELRQYRHGGWRLHQAGTWAPDGDNRWMGSAAMDRKGNIAVGYSVSGSETYPSVRYAARRAHDPRGKLGTEQSCVEGTESQKAVLSSGPTERWGDYSTISVDPQDGCTFWYTNEFYDAGIDDCFPGGCWKTQICSFKLSNCRGK